MMSSSKMSGAVFYHVATHIFKSILLFLPWFVGWKVEGPYSRQKGWGRVLAPGGGIKEATNICPPYRCASCMLSEKDYGKLASEWLRVWSLWCLGLSHSEEQAIPSESLSGELPEGGGTDRAI